MVPDFRIKIPSEHGESQVKLAELKLLSCCPTWYTPAVRSKVRATEKRAQGLQIKLRPWTKQYLVQTEDRGVQSRGGWTSLVTSWDSVLGPGVRPARMSMT